MVKFSKYLKENTVPGWESNYIQYDTLKLMIKTWKKNNEGEAVFRRMIVIFRLLGQLANSRKSFSRN